MEVFQAFPFYFKKYDNLSCFFFNIHFFIFGGGEIILKRKETGSRVVLKFGSTSESLGKLFKLLISKSIPDPLNMKLLKQFQSTWSPQRAQGNSDV